MLGRILYGWNFFRFVRLGIGIYLLIDGLRSGIWMFALFGMIFILMTLFNFACCANGCTPRTNRNQHMEEDEVTFEEVEIKND